VTPSPTPRLLGWRPGRGEFVHDREHRLPHDVVIVDEMSMVSLPLAAKLLGAIRDDATVVFVGDPFQLESIEAGTVLADIVESGENDGDAGAIDVTSNIVKLERVHRYLEGGVVAQFAEAIRTADDDRAIDILSLGNDDLRWVSDRASADFDEMWTRLIEARSDVVELARASAASEALASLNRIAVLCARRRGAGSVATWGRDIEAELDQRHTGLRYGGEWYPGRPVMVTSNDYRLELYNGDIGVTVQRDSELVVAFDRGGTRDHHPARLGEHATVHAMTIHKSQGSQFEEVIVVLPDEESRLLTRELLYTAVTRSKRRIWVVAGEAVVREGVRRSVERASGLAELLRRV
jgi:exodeoxyribonuclease V alpha subunit